MSELGYAFIKDNKIINIANFNNPSNELLNHFKMEFNLDDIILATENAAIGGTYDGMKFWLPQPYPSWIKNEETNSWEPPIPYPIVENPLDEFYIWDEITQSWLLTPIVIQYIVNSRVKWGYKIKTINFLTGLPRSGNTVLSAILNQNPKFYSSPLSPICDMSWMLVDGYLKQNDAIRNFNQFGLEESIKNLPQNYYSNINKTIIFDRAKCWTTPENIKIIKLINDKPKIIFTVRDPLEILSSFIIQYKNNNFLEKMMEESGYAPYYYLPLEDAKCDFLMSSNMDLQKGFLSLHTALKSEIKNNVFFIDYNELILNPKKILNNLYLFLEEEPYNHDLNNIQKIEKDDGLINSEPLNLHLVRNNLEKVLTSTKNILSDYVLTKYSNLNFWKDAI